MARYQQRTIRNMNLQDKLSQIEKLKKQLFTMADSVTTTPYTLDGAADYINTKIHDQRQQHTTANRVNIYPTMFAIACAVVVALVFILGYFWLRRN